ncbi:uncharacterized protein LOC108849552 [Raphanus sativus]|uniref:Uncharacterized protein LOC108849552 n=1 Tax=Raphanus sativus TaxID=3726 RepID=A0A9W3DH05_RAPSA|nr:uncharacterized protein LOC108849552 [Raphanus sativus]
MLVPTNTGLPSAASLLRGRAKVEYMTISELKEFVITAPSLDIDFLWKNGGVMLFALSAPKSFNAPSPHCENTHAVGALHPNTVLAKVELGVAVRQHRMWGQLQMVTNQRWLPLKQASKVVKNNALPSMRFLF